MYSIHTNRFPKRKLEYELSKLFIEGEPPTFSEFKKYYNPLVNPIPEHEDPLVYLRNLFCCILFEYPRLGIFRFNHGKYSLEIVETFYWRSIRPGSFGWQATIGFTCKIDTRTIVGLYDHEIDEDEKDWIEMVVEYDEIRVGTKRAL